MYSHLVKSPNVAGRRSASQWYHLSKVILLKRAPSISFACRIAQSSLLHYQIDPIVWQKQRQHDLHMSDSFYAFSFPKSDSKFDLPHINNKHSWNSARVSDEESLARNWSMTSRVFVHNTTCQNLPLSCLTRYLLVTRCRLHFVTEPLCGNGALSQSLRRKGNYVYPRNSRDTWYPS